MDLRWLRQDPGEIETACDWCGRTVKIDEMLRLKGEHGTVYRACERCVRAWKAGRL